MPDLDGGSLPPPSGPPLAGPSAPDAPRPAAAPAGRRRRRVGPSVRALLLVAMALLITGVVLNRASARHRPGDPRAAGTTPAPGAAGAPGAAVTTPTPSGGAAVSTAGTTNLPGTTVPLPTTVSTSTASSTTASTSTAPTTAATAAPTPATDATPVPTPEPTPEPTTAPDTAPTAAPPPPDDGRAVLLTSRVESCQFGPRCLIVGFTLRGFRSTPATFTCEFANGTRRSFPLGGLQKVGRACTTGTVPDSIRVEVDGVRSETATIP